MLPVVRRELNAAARRKAVRHMRFGAAWLGAFGVFAAAAFGGDFTTAHGVLLFQFGASLAVLFCAGAGLVLTSDCLSREKRENTLGLLFLTRVTGWDIVLGKLTAAGLAGGSAVFAVLPYLAFSLCLGGVTAAQFWSMSLALLLLLAYCLAAGLFVSTLFKREIAVMTAYTLLIVAPPAICGALLIKNLAAPFWLSLLNPLLPALAAADFNRFGISTGVVRDTLLFQAAASALEHFHK